MKKSIVIGCIVLLILYVIEYPYKQYKPSDYIKQI